MGYLGNGGCERNKILHSGRLGDEDNISLWTNSFSIAYFVSSVSFAGSVIGKLFAPYLSLHGDSVIR